MKPEINTAVSFHQKSEIIMWDMVCVIIWELQRFLAELTDISFRK